MLDASGALFSDGARLLSSDSASLLSNLQGRVTDQIFEVNALMDAARLTFDSRRDVLTRRAARENQGVVPASQVSSQSRDTVCSCPFIIALSSQMRIPSMMNSFAVQGLHSLSSANNEEENNKSAASSSSQPVVPSALMALPPRCERASHPTPSPLYYFKPFRPSNLGYRNS